MLEDLSLLIRLQELDNQSMELDAERGDLPEQIEVLSREIERSVSEIVGLEQSQGELKRSKSQQQRVVDDARSRLKKSQSVIYNVKTTREYDAISSEIEQAKLQIAQGEKELLELMAREEQLQASLKEHRDRLSVVEGEHSERQREMKERLESTGELERQLLHEREKIVVRLKRPVYAHYDRIRKIRDGVGVAFVTDSACSYCFSMIPPQRQVEVRRMDDVILCEVCGCILVAGDD